MNLLHCYTGFIPCGDFQLVSWNPVETNKKLEFLNILSFTDPVYILHSHKQFCPPFCHCFKKEAMLAQSLGPNDHQTNFTYADKTIALKMVSEI